MVVIYFKKETSFDEIKEVLGALQNIHNYRFWCDQTNTTEYYTKFVGEKKVVVKNK